MAGAASLCISGWDVSQVLSALKRRQGSGAALGGRAEAVVRSWCASADGTALLRAALRTEGEEQAADARPVL